MFQFGNDFNFSDEDSRSPPKPTKKPSPIKRKFPGPAGLLSYHSQNLNITLQEESIVTESQLPPSQDFTEIFLSDRWKEIVQELGKDKLKFTIDFIKMSSKNDYLKRKKVPLLVAVIMDIDFENSCVTVRDPTGEITAYVTDEVFYLFKEEFTEGAVVVFLNFCVLYPEHSKKHYLMITGNNVHTVYAADGDSGRCRRQHTDWKLQEENLQNREVFTNSSCNSVTKSTNNCQRFLMDQRGSSNLPVARNFQRRDQRITNHVANNFRSQTENLERAMHAPRNCMPWNQSINFDSNTQKNFALDCAEDIFSQMDENFGNDLLESPTKKQKFEPTNNLIRNDLDDDIISLTVNSQPNRYNPNIFKSNLAKFQKQKAHIIPRGNTMEEKSIFEDDLDSASLDVLLGDDCENTKDISMTNTPPPLERMDCNKKTTSSIFNVTHGRNPNRQKSIFEDDLDLASLDALLDDNCGSTKDTSPTNTRAPLEQICNQKITNSNFQYRNLKESPNTQNDLDDIISPTLNSQISQCNQNIFKSNLAKFPKSKVHIVPHGNPKIQKSVFEDDLDLARLDVLLGDDCGNTNDTSMINTLAPLERTDCNKKTTNSNLRFERNLNQPETSTRFGIGRDFNRYSASLNHSNKKINHKFNQPKTTSIFESNDLNYEDLNLSPVRFQNFEGTSRFREQKDFVPNSAGSESIRTKLQKFAFVERNAEKDLIPTSQFTPAESSQIIEEALDGVDTNSLFDEF